ncbi:MAG: PmbA protein [Actinomycetota bacterium]|jgi:PmbA protein|nr:PmbA protein [Actinomycetota bacterium]
MLEVCERVADRALEHEQVEAYGVQSWRANVSARRGAVESVSSTETSGIGVRVVSGSRLGFASTSDLSPDGLRQVLADARDNARYGTPDDRNTLPDDGVRDPQPGPEPARTSVREKLELALEIDRLADKLDPDVRLTAASYWDQVAEVSIASSRGTRAAYRSGTAEAHIAAMVDRDDGVVTSFGYAAGVTLADVSADEVATTAVTRAVQQARPGRAATGPTRLVLEPLVAAELLDVIGRALCGDEVGRGRSVYAGETRAGLAAPDVELVDDPASAPPGWRRPVDDEGVATGRTVLVADGTIRSLLHSTSTAREAGTGSTGNAGRNGHRALPAVRPGVLTLDAAVTPTAALLNAADDAVLVRELVGLHTGVDPVTGRIEVDLIGMWLRGGEPTDSVRDTSLSCTFAELLCAVRATGDDRRLYPMSGIIGGATLLLDGLELTGAT